MSRKKKNQGAALSQPVTHPFNDVILAEAIEDITYATRNLFKNVEERERYETLYHSTSLLADPLSYEITVLRILLTREMEKPDRPRPERKGRGADIRACRGMLDAYCATKSITVGGTVVTQEFLDDLADLLRVHTQSVRKEAVDEMENRRECLRDPAMIVKITNAISTCENIRSKLDSIMREPGYAFRRQQEDRVLTEILADVLKDDLATYWEVAKRYNAMVDRSAVLTIKENIEREMRRRGQLAEDEFLD